MDDKLKFKSQITTRITDIPQQEWDAVFPPIAEGYGYFKTLEETEHGQFKPFYIMLYEDGQAVFAAPCFIMDYPLDTTVEGPIKSALLWLQKRLKKNFTLRILICGCQAAEGRVGIKDIKRADIAHAFLDEMQALARQEKTSLIAFKDFTEDFDQMFEFLRSRRLHKIESYPAVELEIPFHSFEEYFSTLSKATRKDLKRKFKRVDDLPKLTFEVTNRLGTLLDEAYPLYLNTLKKSEVQFERLSRDFFERISENLPQETRYFLWYLDGKMVAFDLCLIRDGVLVDEYIGLDYEVALRYHLYYVTFRDILNWCIENKAQKYESGALNYDPKKRLDFRFIAQNIYVKHLNPIVNVLFSVVCWILKPENFDPALKEINKRHEKH